MSPLRPTNASRTRSSASGSVISPIGVMLCALATLLAVPVLLSTGASSDGDEVVAAAVPETVTASELEADVDIDEMFDAGAKLDDVPEPEPANEVERTASLSVTEASGVEAPSAVGGPSAVEGPSAAAPDDAATDGDSVETPAAAPTPTTSTTISASPATAAPQPTTTRAPTTAPPTTAPPTTAAPVSEAPTTAAPTTAAPEEPSADEGDAVVEAPQAAEEAAAPSGPTAEQWAALRHCESSGNYSVVSSNGLYHGAYQFYQPTWDGLARQLGRADLVGLPPSQAAASDQDALALLLWQQRGSQPWPHCGRHLPAGP